MPQIKTAQKRKIYRSKSYEAVFLDQITADGPVAYEFLLAVFQMGAQAPFLIVSSEKSSPLASLDLKELLGEEDDEDWAAVVSPGTYFLCYFDEKGHFNMGSSTDWADATKFETRALDLIQQKVGERLGEVAA